MRRNRLGMLVAALVLGGLIASTTSFGGPTANSSRAVVKVAFNKKLKKAIVVAGNGRTLYMFTADTGGKSTCAAVDPRCPKLWPALTTTGKPIAGRGINARLLDMVPGGRQVRYNRHPLYYYSEDKRPGDVKGQAFFDVWFVLAPRGTPIRK